MLLAHINVCENQQKIDLEVLNAALKAAGLNVELTAAETPAALPNRRELTLLNRILGAASTSFKVEDVLDTTCHALAEVLNVTRVTAALMTPGEQEFRVVAEHASGPPAARGIQGHLDSDVFLHEAPLIVEDGQNNEALTQLRRLFNAPDGTTLLVSPLIVRERLTGLLVLESTLADSFNDEVAALMTGVAGTLGQVLHTVSLYEELEVYSGLLEQAIDEATSRLRQAKEQVEAILNHSPDTMLMLELDGTIQRANPAFTRMFEYPDQTAAGRTLGLLVHKDDAQNLNTALEDVVQQGQAVRRELTACRADGSCFDADIALAPIQENGRVTGVVCSIRDISALKEVERMKDAFVSNVSHELRTPVTSLQLNQRLLQMHPDHGRTYLDRMERETERLARIIDDLLHLSRLDQGTTVLKASQVDLNTLIEQYVLDRQPLARGFEIALRQELGPSPLLAEVDESMIGQVLSILLTNAIHYTQEGGEIVVRGHQSEDAGSAWVGFSVSDNGPGIPSDEIPKLFNRFFRGRVGRESGAPGTGLGLAIAKEIMTRHQGRIEVKSRGIPGEGTTFYVWVPISQRAAKQEQNQECLQSRAS